MAEIKSTLDLVMEKTRHLTLSEDEKNQQKTEHIQKRINGLIRKYMDEAIKMEQFRQELSSVAENDDDRIDNILMNIVIDRIDPDGDNQKLFEIIDECSHFNSADITARISKYRQRQTEFAEKRLKEMIKELSKQRKISGDAVIPNLYADKKWIQFTSQMNSQFREDISSALHR